MTIQHDIDDEARLIITTMSEDAVDNDLVDAIRKYFNEIKSQSKYESYNEIVDLRKVDGFKIDTNGIRELARISSSYDKKGISSKLAIIASSILAFGFAKIYEIARGLNHKSGKEVRVFKNSEDAYSWIEKD